jgi:phosphoenolpyruvate carboxykinase (ATP)
MQETMPATGPSLDIPIGPDRHNLNAALLYENAIRNGEGLLAAEGSIVVNTGQYTGRSPKDKFITEEQSSADKIAWGSVNQPISEENFEKLRARMMAYIRDKHLYVQDVFVGADPTNRLSVRVYTETAWANLFARNLFIRPSQEELANFVPDFAVVDVPSFKADPSTEGTRTETFIVLSLDQKLVLIGGTEYGGEIKKSMFGVMNYILPQRGVMPMHCSANIGSDGRTALFFGLSGTGKTTLSADTARTLIGDDEHGWSDNGVFNFEGGCYAKVIDLSQKAEPDIWSASHRFGTLLENVVIDPVTRQLNLESTKYTENTRSAYPIEFIANASPTGTGGHARNVMMLTADAFGVMPPIAKLTPDQAMYYFLSGYTAKLAGTERGVTEPEPNFSTCFAAPFIPLPPMVYAKMLAEKIQKHGADVWLVNTGWTGGPYGVGHRMSIGFTRAMVHAALDGSLAKIETRPDPIFGVHVPVSCPGVPSAVLSPKTTWANPTAYDEAARNLAKRFQDNFTKFSSQVTDEVRNAGPRV